ncbi:MAG: DUF4147 domain-containing protein [Candidatus Jorgensenbacteria bacterium]
MKIRNFEGLAKSEPRRAALCIAEAGLEAIDTERIVASAVHYARGTLTVRGKTFTIPPEGKLFVIGVGKCAREAGAALEKVLGKRLTGGILLAPDTSKFPPKADPPQAGKVNSKKLKVYFGSHPYPTLANVSATKEILSFLSELKHEDTVLFAVSGGGSTLLGSPVRNNTIEDEANMLRHLTAAGANIYEVNTLRKHLSLARGGWLAKAAYPAQAIALIFSDVPNAEASFVASGPTVKDETTVAEAERVLKRYDIRAKCRLPHLALAETPKEEKYFERAHNVLVVSNKTALEAMRAEAKRLGFAARVCTHSLQGEARVAGKKIAADIAREKPGTALFYGGETTVTVTHPEGKGGRGLELALAALSALGHRDLILTLASDGRDNTDFAGSISDIMTKEHAAAKRLDAARFLAENGSYDFFKTTGDYLLTGDTGSNVSDLIIALKS